MPQRHAVGMVAAGLGALTVGALAQDREGTQAMAAELLADAAARTSALARADEAFMPKISGFLQFRYMFNQADEVPGEDTAVGFVTPRTRVEVKGKVGDERLSYAATFDFERDGGAGVLRDVYGSWKWDDHWTITWGQFKMPYLREELVGDQYQLAVERSIMNRVFTQDRSQGVRVAGEFDAVRAAFALSDGLGTLNTDFTSSAEADIALTGRLEWKWAGAWKRFTDFTSFPDSEYAGMVGGAVHWQSGGETAETADVDVFGATVDAGAEGNGWNVFGALVVRRADPAAGDDLTDWGSVVHGGVFIAQQTELFGRWDAIYPDGDRANDEVFHTLTVGLNHYFIRDSHAAKFTIDWQYFFEAPTESLVPSASSGRGLGLITSDTGDGQWGVRAQMMLVY